MSARRYVRAFDGIWYPARSGEQRVAIAHEQTGGALVECALTPPTPVAEARALPADRVRVGPVVVGGREPLEIADARLAGARCDLA